MAVIEIQIVIVLKFTGTVIAYQQPVRRVGGAIDDPGVVIGLKAVGSQGTADQHAKGAALTEEIIQPQMKGLTDLRYHHDTLLKQKCVRQGSVVGTVNQTGALVKSIITEEIEMLVTVVEAEVGIVPAVGADVVSCTCGEVRTQRFVFPEPDIDDTCGSGGFVAG